MKLVVYKKCCTYYDTVLGGKRGFLWRRGANSELLYPPPPPNSELWLEGGGGSRIFN